MRRRLLLAVPLLAVACVEPPDPEPNDDDVPPDAATRPALASPLEAEDTDPDPSIVHVALTAAEATLEVGGEARAAFAYNDQVPGPTLRARVGDTLVVDLTNALDTPTTIHWHGVHVPWDMDGVTWQQDPVAPGATFTYRFELTTSGTFWYHPHFDTERQVDLGLYGVLIVEDPAEPAVDEELVLVFDDWGEVEAGEHGEHGLALPTRWLVSGAFDPEHRPASGTVVRVRAVNASNTAYLNLQWPSPLVIARDQGLLAEAETPDAVLLSPGDRAELVWRVGAEAFDLVSLPYSLHGGDTNGDPLRLLSVAPEGSAAVPQGPDWGFPGGAPTPDPGRTDIVYVFAGDSATGRWFINGETFPEVTVESLPLDAEAIIEVRNLSPTEHPFHLHGHAFEVLSDADGPAAGLRLEDTVNVRIYETLRLRLIADNPGSWMAHCHILPHADGGMMTVLQVGDDPTP